MATTYLEMTQGTPTSTRKCTYSGWLKKAENSPSVSQSFLSIGLASDAHYNDFRFETDDAIRINIESASGYTIKTNRLFRDPNAWYHVVVAIDTEQSVAADRVKTYINGVQETSFSEAVYPAEDYDIPTLVSGDKFSIGRRIRTGTMYFNGDMSWVQFVDGLQLAPTEFGELDSTSGIWKIKPAAYATPGNNGFCLKMEDRTNLDLDSSSNAHTFTTTGTLTPTYDNPSNNFCTINPVCGTKATANPPVMSNGNLTLTDATSSVMDWGGFCSMAVTKGKWYWEIKNTEYNSNNVYYGFGQINIQPTQSGGGGAGYYLYNFRIYNADGSLLTNGNGSAESTTTTVSNGDILGIKMDVDNGLWYLSVNGTFLNSGNAINGSVFPTGSSIAGTTWYAPYHARHQNTGDPNIASYNFGNGYFGTTIIGSPNADADGYGAFAYTVPTGYYSLCTKNIATYG